MFLVKNFSNLNIRINKYIKVLNTNTLYPVSLTKLNGSWLFRGEQSKFFPVKLFIIIASFVHNIFHINLLGGTHSFFGILENSLSVLNNIFYFC